MIACVRTTEAIGELSTCGSQLPEKVKRCQNGCLYSMSIGDDDGDNIITVTLRDDDHGDKDPTNGQIMDDGGSRAGVTVDWETYPIDKARVLLYPGLSCWPTSYSLRACSRSAMSRLKPKPFKPERADSSPEFALSA